MLRLFLFAVAMVFAIGFALISPFGALLGYLWYGFFRPESWLWFDVSGFRFSLMLGVLLILRCLMSGVLPNLSHRISIGIVLFLVSCVLAQSNAARPDIGWEWINYFVRLAIVCLLLVSLVTTRMRLYVTILVISASFGALTASGGLRSLLEGGVYFAVGPEGAFVDNNGYALAAGMITPFLLVLADTMPKTWVYRAFWVWTLRGSAIATVYLIVSTFSRGGFLALVVGAILYLILMFRKRLKALVFLMVAGLLVMPFVKLPSGYTERLDTIVTYEEVGDDSALSRLHFWRVAIDMVRDHPLGVGVKNFEVTYDRYDFLNGRFGRGRAVHSSHMQALAENGFIGFGIWCLLFVSAGLTCFRARRVAANELRGTEEGEFIWKMAGALIVSMGVFFVGGSFIALALNDLTWLTFGLVASLDRITWAVVDARAAESTMAAPASRLVSRAHGTAPGLQRPT